MRLRILAFIEDNVATKLVLVTRLAQLGHDIEVLSDVDVFMARLAEGRFDWLLLDEDAVQSAPKDLTERVRRHQGDSRIGWIGREPRLTGLAITARFAKPLSYTTISSYFAEEAPRNQAQRNDGPVRPGTRARWVSSGRINPNLRAVGTRTTANVRVMAKDPVCGTQIDPTEARHAIRRNGRAYYFCSERCRGVFEGQAQARDSGSRASKKNDAP